MRFIQRRLSSYSIRSSLFLLFALGGFLIGGQMLPAAQAQPFSPLNAGLTGVDDGSSSWGDFDGDSDLDLVVTGRDFNNNLTATLYENDVANGNGFPVFGAGLTGVNFSSSDWGDFDGDNDPDLVLTGEDVNGNRTARIYENDVANGNGFQQFGAGLTGVDGGSSDWGDFDGDGDPDLIITGLKTGVGFPPSTTIYENDVANGNGFQPLNAGLVNVKEGSSSGWSDYDQDGDLDIAIAGENANGTPVARIYRNDGGGTFTNIQAGLTGVRFSAIEWGDFTGGGAPDLVVTGNDASGTRTATLYENTSSGFTQSNAGLTGVHAGSVDGGDYDTDGDRDLVVTGLDASGTNSATIYENDGSGNLSPLGAGLTGVGTGSSSWGDFDGDSDLDLVVTGVDDNGTETATIYENNPSSPPPPPSSDASGCIDFEDVTAGTQFMNGDQFSSAGFTIQVDDYQQLDGDIVTDGTVTVDSSLFSPSFSGAGNETRTTNATLRIQFSSTQSGLTFAYRGSGAVNLEVNGDLRVVQALDSLDGKTVGGSTVQVRQVSSGTPVTGFLTVQGPVDELAVGGQEFGVDDICPGCITFEDLSAGASFAQGTSVTTGGFTVELQPYTFSDGTTFTDGDLTILNDTLNAFQLGNKAFMGNVLLVPQLSTSEDTISFVYEDFGGNVNLRVNSDLRFDIPDFAALDGQTVGGAQVQVDSLPTSPGGQSAGLVTITGTINDLGIGGQELYLDDICPRGPQDGGEEGNVFVVNSVGGESDLDPGNGTCLTSGEDCTLRAAIEETNALANASTGPDEIHFDISGAGPHTIQPQSPLPDVTDRVVIDGSTEPDFSGDPVVAIDGAEISASNLNLESGSGGSSVLDLSLINSGNDIALFIRTSGNLVDGCWIGLAPDGTTTPSNSWGLRTFGSSNQIGDPNRRGNVVVGASTGIGIAGGPSNNNVVQNNLIGQTPSGSPAGNDRGINVGSGTGDAFENMIGGTGPNQGNLIAHNTRGVTLTSDDIKNTVRGNQIFDNGNLGLDIAADGTTPNDAGDGDDGINRLQNFPEIQSADYDAQANEVTVTYQVPSDPNATGSGASAYPLTIDFYRADAAQEEGKAYLSTDTYTTSDYNTSTSGPDPKTITFTPAAPATDTAFVVATATDANGNTSEFSAQSKQLPVELTSLEATQTNEQAVKLTWTTASETNNAGFAVQRRRVDGPGEGTWKKVGFVDGTGTTSDSQTYAFTDADLPYAADSLSYRLRQVDVDGTASMSETVLVKRTVNELKLLGTYPNPARKQATVRFAVPGRQTVTLRLYDVLGRRVRTVARGPQEGRKKMQIDLSTLPSGTYFLRLTAGDETQTQKLTVVQ